LPLAPLPESFSIFYQIVNERGPEAIFNSGIFSSGHAGYNTSSFFRLAIFFSMSSMCILARESDSNYMPGHWKHIVPFSKWTPKSSLTLGDGFIHHKTTWVPFHLLGGNDLDRTLGKINSTCGSSTFRMEMNCSPYLKH